MRSIRLRLPPDAGERARLRPPDKSLRSRERRPLTSRFQRISIIGTGTLPSGVLSHFARLAKTRLSFE